jgi:aldose 1-epimerase
MTELALANESLRLSLAPDIGGTVLRFEAKLGDAWVPILRPTQLPLTRSSNGSSFTLAPYSNRLRDGAFRFDGQTYRLRNAEKHAIHGDVRDRPWRVLLRTREEAELELDSRDFADFNFPFPLVCRARFALQGQSLGMALSLRNAGSVRMPAGVGFHPYFNRTLTPGESVELGLRVHGVYPGDTPLPTGPMLPLLPQQDFSRPRPLDVSLDHCFGGWDGRATIRWPLRGVTLRVEATPRFGHVIVYSPPGEPFFAVEPVTNANDGFNLLAAGQADTGVVVLAPTEALEAEVVLHLEV